MIVIYLKIRIFGISINNEYLTAEYEEFYFNSDTGNIIHKL